MYIKSKILAMTPVTYVIIITFTEAILTLDIKNNAWATVNNNCLVMGGEFVTKEDLSIMTSPQLICDFTPTPGIGIVMSYSSIVLSRANWHKWDLH